MCVLAFESFLVVHFRVSFHIDSFEWHFVASLLGLQYMSQMWCDMWSQSLLSDWLACRRAALMFMWLWHTISLFLSCVLLWSFRVVRSVLTMWTTTFQVLWWDAKTSIKNWAWWHYFIESVETQGLCRAGADVNRSQRGNSDNIRT